MRIVVLNTDKCNPKKCAKECMTNCPVVRSGTEMFEFETPISQPKIINEFCTGCGICPRICRFKALSIINTPERLDQDMTHQFGLNGFSLFRLPIIKPGSVNGMVGQNGTGKSTVLKVLSGELIPNFGIHDQEPSWGFVRDFYKGTELQNYFQKMIDQKIRCVRKPQYVEAIPKHIKGTVEETLTRVNERNVLDQLREELHLEHIWNRKVPVLSGGELQKLAIAVAMAREADIYLFDEPTSFLDINERLRIGRVIRSLVDDNKTVVVVEHDLAVLDYLSDYVTTFYGIPASYGIVSQPYTEKEGINVFLDGYIPSENMRFREYSIMIKKSAVRDKAVTSEEILTYPELSKTYEQSGFSLDVRAGSIHQNEIIGILGPNGIGKTTFIKILAGIETPTSGMVEHLASQKKGPEEDEDNGSTLRVAYKPQYVASALDTDLTVDEFLAKTAGAIVATSQFRSEIMEPFRIPDLLDQTLNNLSGGELQKVAIVSTLGTEADLYLIDEPSAFLSIEDRLTAGKIIRRAVQNRNAAAFVVEHDVIFQDYASDRIIVFLGEPGQYGRAYSPSAVRTGMNRFLGNLQITFRRDVRTGRPRVNKLESKLDRQQKKTGEYYYER